MLQYYKTARMQHPMHQALQQSSPVLGRCHAVCYTALSSHPRRKRRAATKRQGKLRGCVLCAEVAVADVTQSSWTDFSQNVSGEWEGVTATFDARCATD